MANQLWCVDFLSPHTPLIILHRLPAFLESVMPIKNWCSIHARWSKSSLKNSIHFCGNSKVSDCIFEIHPLWQSGFSMVYSNSYCSSSFEAETIKIGQSSHQMYSNNILNVHESTTILNAYTKKVWKNLSYALRIAESLRKKTILRRSLKWKKAVWLEIHN